MFVAVPAARWRLLAAFAALYVIWGSTYLAIRIGVASWPPDDGGSPAFCWLAGCCTPGSADAARPPSWRQWLHAGAIGALLLAGGNGGVTVAEQWVASGVAWRWRWPPCRCSPWLVRRCLASAPRRASGWHCLGLAGMLLLNLGANLQASPLGAALLLFASASWAFGSGVGQAAGFAGGPMAAATEMLVGGVVLALASALAGERPQAWPTLEGWLALAYLVVFGSLVAFSAYLIS